MLIAQKYLKTDDVAEVLGVSQRMVRKYITNKKLKAKLRDGAYRISVDDLNKFIESYKH